MAAQYDPETAGATVATTANPTGAATIAQADAVELAVEQAGGRPASIAWTNSIVNNADGSWSVSLNNLSGPSGLTSLFGVGSSSGTLQDTVQVVNTGSGLSVTIAAAGNSTQTFQFTGTAVVEATNAGTLAAGGQAAVIEIGTGAATLQGGSGNDLLIELGNNGTVVGGGQNTQIVLTGNNEQVTAAGSTITATGGASLNLWGYNDTVSLSGTGNYLGLQGSAGDQVTAADSTINASSGSSFNLWGYNDTIGLTGTNVYLGLQGSAGDQVTAAGDTIVATSGSSLNLWGYNDTIRLTGTNEYLGLQGSTGVQVTAAGDTIVATSGSSLNLWGHDDTIGLTGTNEYLGLQGSTGDQVTAAGDTIVATSGSSLNLWGHDDTIGLTGTNEYLGLQGSTGDQVTATGDTIGATTGSSLSLTGNGDTTNLNGNSIAATIVGSGATVNVSGTNDVASLNWGTVNLTGANDGVTIVGSQDVANGTASGDVVAFNGTNETANLNWGTVNLDGNNQSVTINGSQDVANSIWSGDTVGFNGTNETANLSNGTVNLDGDNQNVTINGSGNLAQSIWSGDTIGFNGTNENAHLSGGTVNLDGDGQETTVVGNNDVAGSAWSGNIVGFAGTSDTAQISNGTIYLDNPSTTVTVEGNGDTANSQFSGNTVGFTGRGDTAQITNGTIYTDDTSGGLAVVGSGDTVNAVSGGTQTAPVLDAQTVSDIDAIYNAVLDRDPTAAELIGAQTELATGVGLNGLMGTLANSAELQADMTSTYEAASGAYQSLMTAQPQSNEEQSVSSIAPTQAEFNAFADVMSTSYGAPIEIVSFDPDTGAQTELADTSATNLLAELPVLETEANGVNLGLKLADGTELQFASTARLTTFLYSVAVQQMQATQFVTDNYNLDMQWLNTIDQPLLQEAVFWSEAAAYFQPFDKVRAEELNIESSLALKIAGEAPGSRQNLEQTFKNPNTGNPTQITVFAAADGSWVHDVSGGIGGILEGALTTLLNAAAAAFPETGLPFLAAAVDAAEAGQAFSNGQIVPGLLDLTLAGGDFANLFEAGNLGTILNLAAMGVGGIYGAVQSAQSGNGLGILSGVLEAAAAGAGGLASGEDNGSDTQMLLNNVSAALSLASAGISAGQAIANGDLQDGLLASLQPVITDLAGFAAQQLSGLNAVQDTAQADAAAVSAASSSAAPGAAGVASAEIAQAVSQPIQPTSPSNSVSLTATISGQTATVTVGTGVSGSGNSPVAPLVVEITPAASNGAGPDSTSTVPVSDINFDLVPIGFLDSATAQLVPAPETSGTAAGTQSGNEATIMGMPTSPNQSAAGRAGATFFGGVGVWYGLTLGGEAGAEFGAAAGLPLAGPVGAVVGGLVGGTFGALFGAFAGVGVGLGLDAAHLGTPPH